MRRPCHTPPPGRGPCPRTATCCREPPARISRRESCSRLYSPAPLLGVVGGGHAHASTRHRRLLPRASCSLRLQESLYPRKPATQLAHASPGEALPPPPQPTVACRRAPTAYCISRRGAAFASPQGGEISPPPLQLPVDTMPTPPRDKRWLPPRASSSHLQVEPRPRLPSKRVFPLPPPPALPIPCLRRVAAQSVNHLDALVCSFM